MPKGLGTDIIEIVRIDRIIQRYGRKFLDRMFTQKEQEYCARFHKPAQHFAARFAAKEAIVKALGTGLRDGMSWTDIEISNNEQGKPIVLFSNDMLNRFNDPKVIVSLSHSKEYATAVAIWE